MDQASDAKGPRVVDRGSALPLWAQVHDDLRRRLQDSEFGRAFPSELTLVATYGVSRHTIRQAVRKLREDGVVTAERGRAPRVAGVPDIRQSLGALYSLFASVEAQGVDQRSVVRVVELRHDAEVARRLGTGGTELFYLERLRLADGVPLALDRSWLPVSMGTALLDADFSHTALYAELDRRVGIQPDGGEEHIRAVVPTPEQRALLALPPGIAAFSIDRTGLMNGRPIEWRQTLVRADHFSVTAKFSTSSGYRLSIAPSPADGSPPAARARRARN